MAIGSSLIQAIKNCAKHAHLEYECVFCKNQSLKVGWFFSLELTKLFNVCWNHVLFILYRSTFNKLEWLCPLWFFFSKLSEIDPCEKRTRWASLAQFFYGLALVENLMAFYLVKQACGNDILAPVYSFLVDFFMSKKPKGWWCYILIESSVRNLSHFFDIIKLRKKEYLPSL